MALKHKKLQDSRTIDRNASVKNSHVSFRMTNECRFGNRFDRGPSSFLPTRFSKKQFLLFCLRCLLSLSTRRNYLFYSAASEIVRSNSTPVDGIGVE